MSKKVLGYLVAVLVIGTMVAIMVKTNMEKTEPIDRENLAKDVTEKESKSGLGQGDVIPDFELTTLAGDKIKLSDLQGKKIILNFWASWCGPCKAEMPHMEKYYKKNKEKENVEVIAVNLTTSEKLGVKAVEDFVEAYGLTFPIPLDTEGIGMDQYDAFSIPTTYILNTDGTISQKIIGPMDEKIMTELVDDLY